MNRRNIIVEIANLMEELYLAYGSENTEYGKIVEEVEGFKFVSSKPGLDLMIKHDRSDLRDELRCDTSIQKLLLTASSLENMADYLTQKDYTKELSVECVELAKRSTRLMVRRIRPSHVS